jgi:hypothetical protein
VERLLLEVHPGAVEAPFGAAPIVVEVHPLSCGGLSGAFQVNPRSSRRSTEAVEASYPGAIGGSPRSCMRMFIMKPWRLTLDLWKLTRGSGRCLMFLLFCIFKLVAWFKVKIMTPAEIK